MTYVFFIATAIIIILHFQREVNKWMSGKQARSRTLENAVIVDSHTLKSINGTKKESIFPYVFISRAVPDIRIELPQAEGMLACRSERHPMSSP
jgi:hypothetical protein